MRTCREIEPSLSDVVDGALSEPEERVVQAHLERCAECRGLLASLRRTVSLLRRLGRQDGPLH